MNPSPVNPSPVNPAPVNPSPVNPAPVSNETNLNLKDNIINAEQPTDPAYLKQPVKVTEKKKRKIPLIVLIIILLLAGGFTTYFMLISPQKIFNKAIDKTENEFYNYLDEFDMNNSLTDVSLKINSDNKELEQFTKYKYGFKGGVDSSKKSLEGKIYMLDDKNKEYSASGFMKNSSLYILLSSFDKLIYIDSAEKDEYKNFFEGIENVKKEDEKYLVKVAFASLKRNLNKDNFLKSSANIKVNNKNVKVTKNSYKLTEKENKRIEKAITQDLYNDEKASKIIMNLTGMSKEELKEELKNEEYINNNSNDTTYINIYTNFFGKAIGYDIQTNDKRNASFYQNGNEFDISINDEYNPYHIVGIKKGKKMNVAIKDENKEIVTLNFDKFSKNNISFEYDTKNFLENHYTGKVTYIKTSKKNELVSKFYIKMSDQKNNYEINVDLNKTSNSKIADIDETQAVKLTDEEFSKVMQDFIASLSETPLGSIFTGFTSNDVIDYSEYEQSVY